MEQVLMLLCKEITCLERFYSINERYINNLRQGVFDEIKAFYDNRESVLQSILNFDRAIKKLSFSVNCGNESKQYKQSFVDKLDYKNLVVKKILDQDLEILSYIDQLKSDVLRDDVIAIRKGG